jgi:hypothetical protein
MTPVQFLTFVLTLITESAKSIAGALLNYANALLDITVAGSHHTLEGTQLLSLALTTFFLC